MTDHRAWRIAVAATLALSLQGCDERGFSWVGNRWGPSPVLVTSTAVESANRQVSVVNAMIMASQGVPITPTTVGTPVTMVRSDWYTVVMAGFNVIDDACQSYIDSLWILDRERTAATNMITATGNAVHAIVAISSGNVPTLDILTQAFGLSSLLVNNLAQTYLYTRNPATIRGVVQKLMDTYRQDFTNKYRTMDDSAYPVASYPAAYYRMREYLALCLPPTIESKIEQLLTTSGTGASDKSTVSTVRLVGDVPPETVPVRPGGGGTRVVTNPPSSRPVVTPPSTSTPTVTVHTTFARDGEALVKFVFPTGDFAAPDRGHAAEVTEFMTEKNIRVSLALFLTGASFTNERAELARRLRARGLIQ